VLTFRDMRSNAEVLRDKQVKERVLRGLDLLQEKYGPGWEEMIIPADLEMADGSVCVLGQVYGDYEDGLEELGLQNGLRHGFVEDEREGVSYADLNAAWSEVFGYVAG
jgi:hypothetical protein